MTGSIICLDLVYSPDDHGWYAQETDLDLGKSRVSKRIYSSKERLQSAIKRGTHKWESWS